MTDEQRFNQLSWMILEAKYLYYELDDPKLQDHEYDLLEREYDNLAKKLGVAPTASDMVGFKLDRPSCRLVKEKVDKERLNHSRVKISP